jgi:hypothetical protein
MYAAILGKPVMTETPVAVQSGPAGASPTVQALARWAWAHGVGQVTQGLRLAWGLGSAAAKQPQVAGWLRHLSEEAARHIDQAQVRLGSGRQGGNRRRVQAREVLSIRPVEQQDYKRAA